MITLLVHLQLRIDAARDDAEWWPTVVSFSRDQAPHPMPLVTGATKQAELAWDLVEALLGSPAPHRAYRIEITPADPDDEVDW